MDVGGWPNTELPAPSGWHERTALFVSFALLSGAIAAYFIVKSEVAIQRGHWMAAVIDAIGALLSVVVAIGIPIARFTQVRLRADYGSHGTVLRPPPLAPWMVLLFGALTIGAGLLLLYGHRSSGDLPPVNGRDHGRLIAMLVIGGAGTIMCARSWLRGGVGLTLSPAGVEFTDVRAIERLKDSDVPTE